MFVLGAFVLMILSEMSSSYPLKRNNLDLFDHIGGLSEHGGLREPLETHLDLLLSSTMTLLLVIKYHYESRPMQHTIFTAVKMTIFSDFFFGYFHIFAQNIDCGYTLEPPQCGGSNEYPQSIF